MWGFHSGADKDSSILGQDNVSLVFRYNVSEERADFFSVVLDYPKRTVYPISRHS